MVLFQVVRLGLLNLFNLCKIEENKTWLIIDS